MPSDKIVSILKLNQRWMQTGLNWKPAVWFGFWILFYEVQN